jgi:hypothetical protein
VGSGFPFVSRYDASRFPLDDIYALLRRHLWLATDAAYKNAVEAFSRKQAALKNVADGERLDDFARATPTTVIEDSPPQALDEAAWTARVRALSAVMARYPQIKLSGVELEAIDNTHYYVNSEGSRVRIPERLMLLRARVTAQAGDGMTLRDAEVFHTHEFDRMPAAAEMERRLANLGERVTALAAAPKGEAYNGPVLFEDVASAQVFAEVLGRNLTLTRRPVTEPGRPATFPASELEGRQGARVLPEWMDVVDDPTQTEWRGRALFGSYPVDREGVVPGPLVLVEKGVLKNFLLTRQPVRGFSGSNGRARMPGNFGASAAAIGNMFVRASQTVSADALRKKLLELCAARSKPYGIVVRRMDFPSSANIQDARRMLTGGGQSGERPVSDPILVYKVFPDGREEAMRGVRFRGLNVRSLRDIVAAGEGEQVFDFLNNTAPFALMGMGGVVVETSVVAPPVLVDDVELRPVEEEQPKLPVVPPPT